MRWLAMAVVFANAGCWDFDLLDHGDAAIPDLATPNLVMPDLVMPDLVMIMPDLRATCGDGIKNGDETGVDCGGSCMSCKLPSSCNELLALQPTAQSGVYMIDVDQAGPNQPFSVYCDMAGEGGGWTLVASSMWNSKILDYDSKSWSTPDGISAPTNPLAVDFKSKAFDLLAPWTVVRITNSVGSRNVLLEFLPQTTPLQKIFQNGVALVGAGVKNFTGLPGWCTYPVINKSWKTQDHGLTGQRLGVPRADQRFWTDADFKCTSTDVVMNMRNAANAPYFAGNFGLGYSYTTRFDGARYTGFTVCDDQLRDYCNPGDLPWIYIWLR